jgi:hypothetical protein
MASISLKLVTTFGAIYAVRIIFLVAILFSQDAFLSYTTDVLIFKLCFAVSRVTCLFLCTWAAWHAPRLAAWFAFGACVMFSFGGAGDQIYTHGFSGFGNLLPTYYWTVCIHGAFALIVWLIARKVRPTSVYG